MKRVVFLPDRPLDAKGDLFGELASKLGLEGYEIDGDPGSAEVVAYVGKRRAEEFYGKPVRTGPQPDGRYVLPSTAPEERRFFFEGVWRNFASAVTGRDLAVRDEFKGMTPEQIRAALAPRRHEFGVLVANVHYDINLGSILRTCNAFLAREVVIYGRRKTDLRGAMGAHVYENLVHVRDLAALDAFLATRAYTLVCFEQTEGAIDLRRFLWPRRPLLIFGQEGPGVPPELLARASHTVRIPQFGSIRSLNVAVAAGIAIGAALWGPCDTGPR